MKLRKGSNKYNRRISLNIQPAFVTIQSLDQKYNFVNATLIDCLL